MSQSEPATAPPPPPPPTPQARPYRGLIWLLPGLALLGIAAWAYVNTEPGGTVESITVRSRTDLVGQATDTLSAIRPGTPDLYLIVTHADGTIQTDAYEDTPIGNGLTWALPEPLSRDAIQKIEVWDEDTFRDSIEDQVSPTDWQATGQKYEVVLNGTPNAPPDWAWPVGAVGAVIVLWALIRFVRDQVI